MKKFLLLSIAFLPIAMQAELSPDQIPDGIRYEKGVYALKISPNGKWIGSQAGDASIYNVETGENIYYDGCLLGIGSAIANNGMAVASLYDTAAILYQGTTIRPETLINFWFCDINAITPDAKRIGGLCNNPDTSKDAPTYVPFVCDLDENLNVGEPIFLPFPELDFFGSTPMYATVISMSDDGKTCYGSLVDWRGMFSAPIYYQEDENGNWTYTTPSKHQFNPTGIYIPRNPWLDEPEFPEPENFMSGANKEIFSQIYDAWISSGGVGEMPGFETFMSEEEYQTYKEAVETYNAWYYAAVPDIKEYIAIYDEVLDTSPGFGGNDVPVAPSGDYFITTGTYVQEDGKRLSGLLKISTVGEPVESYPLPERGLYPSQILSDGTIIMTKGIRNVPDSYIFLPGAEKGISVTEYLQPDYPQVASWINEILPGGNGVICMSDDKSVITGALVPEQYAPGYHDFEFDYYYHTYMMGVPDIAGVEEIISEPADGVYKVYNLQGVKMLETKDYNDIRSLAPGLYLVNNKKVMIR